MKMYMKMIQDLPRVQRGLLLSRVVYSLACDNIAHG